MRTYPPCWMYKAQKEKTNNKQNKTEQRKTDTTKLVLENLYIYDKF